MSKRQETSYNRAKSLVNEYSQSKLIKERSESVVGNELKIIQNLTSFADEHIDFFYQGLKIEVNFVESPAHPIEYVMGMISQRISLDFEIWRQIFAQRSTPVNESDRLSQLSLTSTQISENNGLDPSDISIIAPEELIYFNANQIWANKLEQADYLNLHALRFAKELGFLDFIPHTWSYFATRPSMRVIPYAPIAMIAIPYTTISTPQDMLAIAHEIGHYVYWHGKAEENPTDVEKKFIHQMIKENDHELLIEWGEEIFADVFGAMIAGGLLGIDFMHYVLSQSLSDFKISDGHHPTPALRPVIYYEALKYFEPYGIAKVHGETLETLWEVDKSDEEKSYLSMRGIDKSNLAYKSSSNEHTLEDFKKALCNVFKHPIFTAFSKINEPIQGEEYNFHANNWTVLAGCTDTSPDNWLEQWEKLLEPTVITNENKDNPDPSVLTSLVSASDSSKNLNTILKIDQIIQCYPDEDPNKTIWETWFKKHNFAPSDGSKTWQPKDWLRVLDAGDWTIEGPHASKHDDP